MKYDRVFTLDTYHCLSGTRLPNFNEIEQTFFFCLKQVFCSPGLLDFTFSGEEASLRVIPWVFGPIAGDFTRIALQAKIFFLPDAIYLAGDQSGV